MKSQHDGNYVHSLLFQCGQCGEPLAVPVVSFRRTLEEVDATSFDLKCKCGWSKHLMGAEARRHWVDSWSVEKKSRE